MYNWYFIQSILFIRVDTTVGVESTVTYTLVVNAVPKGLDSEPKSQEETWDHVWECDFTFLIRVNSKGR